MRPRHRREEPTDAEEPATKVVVIGLDCAEPSLVFDRFADRLPNLTRLRERGPGGSCGAATRRSPCRPGCR